MALPASIILLYGCQSSSRQLVGPSGTKCEVSIPGHLPSVGAEGGNGTLTISAARECAWSVTSGAPWISITSDRTGQGPGVVNYAAAINPTPAARRGALTVADQQVELLQEAAPCQFTFTPSALAVDADGGESLVAVNAIAGCAWTGASETSWIEIIGPREGSGAGSVRLRTEPNPGAERTGRISIAGQTYTVSQHRAMSPECLSTLDTTADIVPAAGSSMTVTVSAPAGCLWTATTQAPWIRVTGGDDGSGVGSVELTVEVNTGAERVGIVRIAGQTYTVTQRGHASTPPACAYTLESSAQSVASVGGGLSVNVTTSTGCVWTAVSQVAWITISSGAQNTGSGAVAITVAANDGGQRSGAVSIAGQTFTVTQSAAASPAPCSYRLEATAQSVPAGGGSVTVAVSASSGCTWTAASQVTWITVSSGAQGSGNGSVTLAVASHTGSERSGVVTIAGQTFTVTQALGAPTPLCSFSLGSGAQSVPAAGGALTVSVSTSSGCAWTATSEAAWITVTSGAQGSGNGTVTLNVASHTGAQRSAVVTIAGETFTVTQASGSSVPPPCAYNLSSTAVAVIAAGSAVTTDVATTGGCTWTATSQAAWITISGGASGSGHGTVSLTVAENTGSQRVGTVAIAGQTFTVTQAAAAPPVCSYSISPTEQAVPALGGTFSVTITTQSGCAWSATANVQWIEINGNRNGSGSGTMTYKVSLGTIVFSREGTITVAGLTLKVSQAGLLITGGP